MVRNILIGRSWRETEAGFQAVGTPEKVSDDE